MRYQFVYPVDLNWPKIIGRMVLFIKCELGTSKGSRPKGGHHETSKLIFRETTRFGISPNTTPQFATNTKKWKK